MNNHRDKHHLYLCLYSCHIFSTFLWPCNFLLWRGRNLITTHALTRRLGFKCQVPQKERLILTIYCQWKWVKTQKAWQDIYWSIRQSESTRIQAESQILLLFPAGHINHHPHFPKQRGQWPSPWISYHWNKQISAAPSFTRPNCNRAVLAVITNS